MRILVVPSWYPPNGGRFFRLQAEALALKGHEVDVLVLHEKGLSKPVNKKIDAQASPLLSEIKYSFLRIPKMNGLNVILFIFKFRRLLINYLKYNKPDIIHVHSAVWAGVVVRKIAQKFNIPYVITEHRSIFFEEKFPFGKRKRKEIENALNEATKLIAVSNGLKDKLKNFSQRNDVEVIPNMVDVEFFLPFIKRKSPEKFVFVSVGNLIALKGFDTLIDAFALLFKEFKEIQLKIVGEGEERYALEQKVEQLGLQNDIIFSGYRTRKELKEIYQSSDVYISASKKESFGVVIIEALSCGLPIIVTNSGGPTEIVNENNGFLVAENNASSLHQYMKKMYLEYGTFDSVNIRKETVNRYSKEVVVSQIDQLLKSCLKSKSR